jgi:hypothetical protein
MCRWTRTVTTSFNSASACSNRAPLPLTLGSQQADVLPPRISVRRNCQRAFFDICAPLVAPIGGNVALPLRAKERLGAPHWYTVPLIFPLESGRNVFVYAIVTLARSARRTSAPSHPRGRRYCPSGRPHRHSPQRTGETQLLWQQSRLCTFARTGDCAPPELRSAHRLHVVERGPQLVRDCQLVFDED